MLGNSDTNDFTARLGWKNSVEFYSQLGNPAEFTGEVAKVSFPSGTWALGTKRKAGLYESNGVSWNYLGTEISLVSEAEKEAGTLNTVRRFTPRSIYDMIILHMRYHTLDNTIHYPMSSINIEENQVNNLVHTDNNFTDDYKTAIDDLQNPVIPAGVSYDMINTNFKVA